MDSGDAPHSLCAKEFVIEFIEYRLDGQIVASTQSGHFTHERTCHMPGFEKFTARSIASAPRLLVPFGFRRR